MKTKNILILCLASVFIFGFAAWSLIAPDNNVSVSERRPLAQIPALNSKAILSGSFMSDFEKYSLDQFPLRDEFRALKAFTSLKVMGQQDSNGVYFMGDHISKLEYPMDSASIEHAAERFRFIYDKYLKASGSKVYLSLIPDKNCFIPEDSSYPRMDYEAFAKELRSNMDYAEYIDIAPLLELDDFYRTDIHWRQEKIVDVAQHLATAMGAKFSGNYSEKLLTDSFYGVYYGQSALPTKPEELYCLESDLLASCTVFDYETNGYTPVYDLARLDGNDPFEVFLSGPKSLLVIENPELNCDKELIIFRDSFTSSLAPLLMEGYSKITLVDIRYLSPAVVDKFIEFTGQDVLFIYSSSVLNNSITLK